MSNSTTMTRPVAPPATSWVKPALWTTMALMTIVILVLREVPLFRKPEEYAAIHEVRWFLIPHMVTGTIAFLLGPFQFSSRLRIRHPKLHRAMGRAYIYCAVIAAITIAAVVVLRHPPVHRDYWLLSNFVMITAWLVTTLGAFITACSRRFVQHRLWAARSYAVTFTFTSTRMSHPFFPHLSRGAATIWVIFVTLASILAVDLGLRWHNFFPRRG